MTASRLPEVHDRAWFERRLDGFGASEAAATVGISRWRSTRALVEEKGRRIIPDPDAPQRLRLRLGQELEPILREHAWEKASERFGPQPRPRSMSHLYRMPGYPFITANVDGFIGDALLELKTDEWGYEPWGDEGGDPMHVVPPYYLVQVQHALAATRRLRALLFVQIGLHDQKLYVIPRDEDYIADLVETEAGQWATVLLIRARLAADPEADIEDLLPPLTGPALSEDLKRRFRENTSESILPATAEQEAKVAAWRDSRRARIETEHAEEAAKDALKAIIGLNSGLSSTLGTITWRKSADSTVVRWDLIAAAYRRMVEGVRSGDLRAGDIAPGDLDLIQSIHTETVPGSRPFVAPKAWDRPAAYT